MRARPPPIGVLADWYYPISNKLSITYTTGHQCGKFQGLSFYNRFYSS
jgi:hypothetical protein